MNWNTLTRQAHRWLSILFTALVIANVVVNFTPLRQETLALWLGLFTLLPLILLLVSGIYLFALPYAARWRAGRRQAISAAD